MKQAEKISLVNQNLAKLLETMSIRPTLLRVYYTTTECTSPYGECEMFEWNDDCKGCNYFKCTKNIKTLSFYTYDVTDAWLNGICSDFETHKIFVDKIEDANTGKLIYKAKEKVYFCGYNINL